jgi:hypothetical protein
VTDRFALKTPGSREWDPTVAFGSSHSDRSFLNEIIVVQFEEGLPTDDPMYSCGETNEIVAHYLLQCNNYEKERETVRKEVEAGEM